MYKIAVASSDGKNIDLHFGRADQFYIYEVAEDGGFTFAEHRKAATDDDSGTGGCGADNADCGTCRNTSGSGTKEFDTRLIADCRFVLVRQIGMHALQFLASEGITAFDVEGSPEPNIHKVIAYNTRLAARLKIQSKRKEK
ncbi:MAG: hydrogenase [Oscillospiraceae bacterium]|nr:hydrogenase [Oscillospiraceae bacterium]